MLLVQAGVNAIGIWLYDVLGGNHTQNLSQKMVKINATTLYNSALQKHSKTKKNKYDTRN
jgi:hypothetical protein